MVYDHLSTRGVIVHHQGVHSLETVVFFVGFAGSATNAESHLEEESRAFARSAVHTQVRTHQADDLLTDGQSQSGSAIHAGRGPVLLREGLEDGLLF